MALNLDTALRVKASISGLNDFKALTDGLKGVDAASRNVGAGLKEAGKQLQSALQPTDDQIAKLREDVLSLGAASKQTERSLDQQVAALKTLKAQASIGGSVYRSLADDIQRLGATASTTQRTRGALAELFITIDKVTAASNGSINALQRQRSAWEALRLAVNPAAPAYAKATAEVKRLDDQLQKLTGTQQKAQQRGIGREALGGALGTLATGGGAQGAIGALAGGLAFSGGAAGLAAGAAVAGVGAAAALAARVGVEAETAQVRLKALTDQFGEYNQAQTAAARIAGQLRISTIEAQDGFGKLYAALRPTGVTLQEIEDAFVGFTAAARASGATAVESSAALLQLKQALGSGVLQGDELRSIREQAPAVGQAIAKEMGVTIGELKKLGSEGQITTDIVLRALAKLKNEKLDQLNAQFDTAAQAQKDLQNATQEFGVAVSKAFGPAVVSLIRVFTAAVNLAADALDRYNQGNQDVKNRAIALERASQQTGTRNQWDPRLRAAFERELAKVRAGEDRPTTSQVQERQAAEAERQAARLRAAQAAADDLRKKAEAEQKKADQEAEQRRKQELDYQNDLFNIRLNAEKRLRDFREQSLERAKQMERDLADQRLELERRTGELNRQAAGQRQDFLLKLERDNLAAIGGDTSSLDIEIEATQALREASNQRIRNEQEATDRRVTLERAVENYKLTVAQGIRDILVEAGEQLADRMQQGAQGAAAALGRVSPGGVIARTGNTGDSTGPHLDGRWADRRPITVADLDRYVRLGGRTPSSYGVTSGYGPRSLFGRSFHAGVDVGTPNGTPITLTGGATFGRDLGNTGAGGYAVEIMTPEGPMRLLHLSANSVRRPSAPGTASNSIRSLPSALRPATAMQPMDSGSTQVPGVEGINAAAAKLQQASDALRTASDNVAMNGPLNSLRARRAEIMQPLGQQQQSSRNDLEDFQRAIDLQRSGMSAELARQSVERARMAEQEQAQLQTLENQTVQYLQQKDLTAEQRQQAQALLEATRQRAIDLPQITANLDREAVALERLRDLEADRQQLIEGIAGTIGNGLTSAMDGLVNGTDAWGDSLRNIAGTVLKDIAKQLLQIYAIQPATQGLQSLLGGLFGGGTSAAAAAGAIAPAGFTGPMLSGVPTITGAFANGGIMTDAGPLPLNTYARGGVASSPQLALFGEGRMPEAFVPLPDGRRIPVAMQGGSGGSSTVNNVTVNVDATGSNVQSDDQQGRELGRVIAAAVQAELVKQKRPGGILTR